MKLGIIHDFFFLIMHRLEFYTLTIFEKVINMDINPLPANPINGKTALRILEARPDVPFNGETAYFIAVQSGALGTRLCKKVYLRTHNVIRIFSIL